MLPRPLPSKVLPVKTDEVLLLERMPQSRFDAAVLRETVVPAEDSR